MTNPGDPAELPNDYYKNIIESIANEEQYENYELDVSLASGKGENFLGVLYRVKITGTRGGDENSELSLVAKLPLQIENINDKFPVDKIYKREVYMYERVLPKLKQIQDSYDIPDEEKTDFVKCYKSSSEAGKQYIIMEDLNSLGFRMAQRRQPLTYPNLKLLIEKVARYHALTLALKYSEPEVYDEFASNLGNIDDFPDEFTNIIEMSGTLAVGVLTEEDVKDRVKEFNSNVRDKMDYFLSASTVDNCTVLCHGDCWINNILFKSKGEETDLRFIDWQMSKNASPITDLAYILATSTDKESRDKYFVQLMNVYHQTLGRSLKHMGYDIEKLYPIEKFNEHIKKIMPYGLLLSFCILHGALGEVEDVPDMESIAKKDKFEMSDLEFKTKDASSRFEIRMRDLARFYVENNFI